MESRRSDRDRGDYVYGNNLADAYRRNGIYVGRILKGDKPGDLPIDRATKFELSVPACPRLQNVRFNQNDTASDHP
jgi:hypothetical protein